MRTGPELDEVSVTVAVATLVGLALLLAMPQGFFSGDEGVKLIQSQALARSGFRSPAIDYPGEAFDPAHRHFPLVPPFRWRHAGQEYGIYSLPFAAAGAVAWLIGGLRGVLLLSWLGAALALLLTGRLARRLLGPRLGALAVAALALGSPLLLYGTLNFEHTWATALLLATVLLCATEQPEGVRLAAAGGLLGLGAAIRPELYCAAPGLCAFALIYWGASTAALRRLVILGAAAAVLTGCYLLANELLLGSVHPNMAAAGRQPKTWADNLLYFFPAFATGPAGLPGWSLLVAALLAGCVPAQRPRLQRLRWAAMVCVGLATGYATVRGALLVPADAVGPRRTLAGLFAASPLLVLALARGLRSSAPGSAGRLAPACAAAGAGFAATVFLARMPGAGGHLELGSRYLLPAVPLLLVAALDGVRAAPRAVRATAVALLLAGLLATLVNARSTWRLRRQSSAVLQAVAQSGAGAVVTSFFWAPQLLAPIFFEQRIFAGPDLALIERLAAAGIDRVVQLHAGIAPHSGPRVRITEERVLVPPRQVVLYRIARVAPGRPPAVGAEQGGAF
jgi:hypothetical protein